MNQTVGDKLRVPGIGLIISGIINGAIGALALVSGLIRFSGLGGREILPADQNEKIGYLIGTFVGYGAGFLSLAAAPVVIFGGFRLLKGQSRGLVMTAAILAILPVTSCCFIVTIIFGVWTLVLLRNPEVKLYFQSDK
jgi:hypothetical protein